MNAAVLAALLQTHWLHPRSRMESVREHEGVKSCWLRGFLALHGHWWWTIERRGMDRARCSIQVVIGGSMDSLLSRANAGGPGLAGGLCSSAAAITPAVVDLAADHGNIRQLQVCCMGGDQGMASGVFDALLERLSRFASSPQRLRQALLEQRVPLANASPWACCRAASICGAEAQPVGSR